MTLFYVKQHEFDERKQTEKLADYRNRHVLKWAKKCDRD